MGGVRQHTRLENGCEVLRVHAVLISFGGKNCEEIEDVEQQLPIKRGKLSNEPLVLFDG